MVSDPEGLTPSLRAKERQMKRYAVVIEKADGNYSAYVPDLP